MTGSVAWVKPAFNHKTKKAFVKTLVSKHEESQVAVDGGNKAVIAAKPQVMQPTTSVAKPLASGRKQQTSVVPDENMLLNRLLQDGIVDQVKGFLVERRYNELYINGQLVPEHVAGKYLQDLSENLLRVQVFPMEERMRMHPDADFIQLLLPFTFESPCLAMPSAKEGC
jgi:hypothetical protein